MVDSQLIRLEAIKTASKIFSREGDCVDQTFNLLCCAEWIEIYIKTGDKIKITKNSGYADSITQEKD